MLDLLPAWKDQKVWEADRQRIVEYAKSVAGYSNEEIAQAYDPRAIVTHAQGTPLRRADGQPAEARRGEGTKARLCRRSSSRGTSPGSTRHSNVSPRAVASKMRPRCLSSCSEYRAAQREGVNDGVDYQYHHPVRRDARGSRRPFQLDLQHRADRMPGDDELRA